MTADYSISTYNRYTYYRLLSQMGVESAPEQNKLNLNYVNVDANGNVVPDMETNLIPWTPLQFFTNAADRMLRDYSQEWHGGQPVELSLATFNADQHLRPWLEHSGAGEQPVCLYARRPARAPARRQYLRRHDK